MSITVEFGELPPSGKGNRTQVLEPIAEALKERPGEWAKVMTGTPRGTLSVYQQRLKKKGCEAVARNTTSPDGGDLWARWPEVAS